MNKMSRSWRKHTNAMSVLLNATMVHGRQIVVYDVHDVAHIDAASRHTRGDQDWPLAAAEATHGGLALPLVAICVHRGARHALVVQVVIHVLGRALRVDEDDGTGGRQRLHEIDQRLLLEGRVDVDDALLDVFMGAASPADAEPNVSLGQMGLGELTSSLGEGGGEEHVIDVALFLLY